MRFNFHLAACAASNTLTAKLREGLRLACLAGGMHRMGEDVTIVNVSPELRSSFRFDPFKHLLGDARTGVNIYPAEMLKGQQKRIDVGFKCSVGIQNDGWYLDRCRVLVAHEYDPKHDERSNLLPVPFMVHDSVMDQFIWDGLFERFLSNDVEAIRAFYYKPKTGLLGMRACTHYPRRLFCESAPEWADLGLYTVQQMTPKEHLPWLSQFVGGLLLPGTTPKSNLMSLLALLGVAIVAPPINVRDTPRMNGNNTVIFHHDFNSGIAPLPVAWDAVRSELDRGDDGLEYVISQATSDYVNSWSPQGQARLLVERLK